MTPPALWHSQDKDTSATTLHTVYLALGANLGDRRGNLIAALQRLQKILQIESISSIYETEPVGYTEQPQFFNLVCQGKTRLDPESLLIYAKKIESELGRQASFRNAPRPIDIDILFYDDLILQEAHLTIPHPRMHERAFVLVPLAEIVPTRIDPVNGKTVAELLASTSQEGINKLAPDLSISLDTDIQEI